MSRLSDEYDVSEAAIRKDIQRLPRWISDVSVGLQDGLLRVRQVRDQVQELEQLALEAHQEGDLSEARRCREAIVKSVRVENKLAQRLGITNEEPIQIELAGDLDPKDERLLDEFTGIDGEGVDLEEMR